MAEQISSSGSTLDPPTFYLSGLGVIVQTTRARAESAVNLLQDALGHVNNQQAGIYTARGTTPTRTVTASGNRTTN